MDVTREEILGAVRALLTVRDGAVKRDDQGFNGFDRQFVDSVMGQSTQTDKQVRALWHLLRKYKVQLQGFGIEYERLVPPSLQAIESSAARRSEADKVSISFVNTQYGRRVAIAFTYSKRLVEACRKLEKRWFDGQNKCWLIPDELEHFDNALQAIEQVGVPIVFSRETSKFFDAEREKRRTAIQASRAADAGIEVPTKLPLLPFQRAGVKFIEEKNGRALVADAMGLGKTPQSIGFLTRHPEACPALVVVPASIRINWYREVGKFSDLKACVIASKSNIRGLEKLGVPVYSEPVPGYDIYITNYDILKGELLAKSESFGFKALILDECQAIKEQKSKRTKACLELSRLIPHVILLTGTPLMNRPKEVFTLVQAVNPNVFPKFFPFAREFCGAFQGRFGWDFSGAKNLDRLDRILRSTVMVRREKLEVLKELPNKRNVTVPVTINGHSDEYAEKTAPILEKLREQQAQRKIWKEKMAAMSEADRREFTSKHAEQVARMGRLTGTMAAEIEELRQEAAKAKLDVCIERIVEMQEEAGKLLVFAHHHEIVDGLVAGLVAKGLKVVKVDGRDNVQKRQDAIDAFQTGDAQVAVLSILAAGVGLNLTAGSDCVFVELPWRPSDVEQAVARAWRIGQTRSVTAWFLVAVGTIEQAMAKMIDTKAEVVNAAVGEGHLTVQDDGILDAILDEVLA